MPELGTCEIKAPEEIHVRSGFLNMMFEPPPIQVAAPSMTIMVPRVAIKDGMRAPTIRAAFIRPQSAPSAAATTITSTPSP